MTAEELNAAIEIFRKATEDLIQANVRSIYKSKYGETNIIDGTTVISLPSAVPEEVYTNASDYEIRLHEALDNEGINILEAIIITNKTTTTFTVSSPAAALLKWETFLKVPNFNYHT